jgi:hypothetical protein
MAYDQFRRSPWYTVSEWIAEQFKVKAPSRTALYNWAARMRKDESAHRVEQAIVAREEIGVLAEAAGTKDEILIEAFKAQAVDSVMRGGSVQDAERFTNMAIALGAGIAKRMELELKERAQGTKEETLRLAREKFDAAERRLREIREAVTAGKTAEGGLTEESIRAIEEAAKLL